jgi:hypothetical protein
MSTKDEPPPVRTIAFDTTAQITRAVVRDKQIVFEIRVPDERSAKAYQNALDYAFTQHMGIRTAGAAGSRGCPVKVTLDGVDKTKVLATYTLRTDHWPKHGMGLELDAVIDAFKDGDLAHLHTPTTARGGLRLTSEAEAKIEAAFDALEELNEQPSTPRWTSSVEAARNIPNGTRGKRRR